MKQLGGAIRIIAIILGTILFPVMGYADSSKLSLNDILCTYLARQSESSLKNDEEWQELVNHLEKRIDFENKTLETLEKSSFRECLSRYSHDMEVGEFILEGRDTLVENSATLVQKAPTNPPLLSVSFSVEDRQLSTPEFAITSNISSETDAHITVVEERLRFRIDRYNSLWESFLDTLRKRLTNPA
jgi:hypothetical protein